MKQYQESDKGGILPQHSTCPGPTCAEYCHSLLLLPSQLLLLLLLPLLVLLLLPSLLLPSLLLVLM